MQSIAILGSTGSIGRQALDIIQAHPNELKVVALAAGKSNLGLLAEQVRQFNPELVCTPDAQSAGQLKAALNNQKVEIVHGAEGLIDTATHPAADTVVTAVVGFLGLLPTAAAIKKGKKIALANKETLVAAGNVIMPMSKQYKSTIVPVDSEHSAIFQSLGIYQSKQIRQIILTGSGGPFRTWSQEQINNATIDDALKHPNWSMGAKITIDSATLMNKGLEIIEARWLFDVLPNAIKVVIHPQSILHSAVEFIDGSVIGQMGLPDMRLPIHFALFCPDRIHSVQVPQLDLLKLKQLTFEEPNYEKFPCLAIATEIAKHESTLPCVLNAANEMAVAAFLKGSIKFVDISCTIEKILDQHKPVLKPTLEDILEADKWARQAAVQLSKIYA